MEQLTLFDLSLIPVATSAATKHVKKLPLQHLPHIKQRARIRWVIFTMSTRILRYAANVGHV